MIQLRFRHTIALIYMEFGSIVYSEKYAELAVACKSIPCVHGNRFNRLCLIYFPQNVEFRKWNGIGGYQVYISLELWITRLLT